MAASIQTSFQKRVKSNIQNYPGVQLTSANSNPVVSTGVRSLDSIIDGGLPLGSLCVIEEDESGNYAKMITKYYLAEGITNGNFTFVASMDENPWDIVNGLPSPTSEVQDEEVQESKSELKIAWRYEELTLDTSKEVKGKTYDLSLLYKLSHQEKERISIWDGISTVVDQNLAGNFLNPWCRNLIQSVSNSCMKVVANSSNNPNFVRLAISSYGSPLWQFKENISTDFTTTLMLIKSILRTTNSVAMVTIPHHLLNEVTIQRYHDIADFVLCLKTLNREKELRSVMDIHGVLELKKVVNLVSLKPFLGQSGTTTYGFKATKRKFKIERLHLPPALGDKKSDTKDGDSVGFCSGQKSKIEF